MNANPLLKLLPYLSRKEMTRFKDFSLSPYFNKHADVRRLVDFLSKAYPKFDEKKLERKSLFQALFPDETHDQAKLALVFTYTQRLLEKFIHLEEATKDGELKSPHRLLRFMREREILFWLEKKWKENYKGVIDSKLLSTQSTLELTSEMDASAIRLSRFDRDFLSEKQAMLDTNFMLEKLRDACEMLQRSKYLKQQFTESPMLSAVCLQIEENEAFYHNHPSILVHHRCYKLLSKGSPSAYNTVLEAVETNATELDKGALQNIYNYLQNFCIAQINQGNQPFLRKLFDIYRSQLERALLLVNGRLPEWHFKNIVTTGLRLDEHEWVRQFLESHRPLLDPEVMENAYSYNLAAYYYHLNRFSEVLELLVQVEYTDLRYNLDAKSLLLRTYFDLEEEEPLLAMSAAFRQFLKRNRSLTDFQKKGYYNLLKYTRRAFRLKMSKGFSKQSKWDAELQKLELEINKAEAIFNQRWLEGKLEEMKAEKPLKKNKQ